MPEPRASLSAGMEGKKIYAIGGISTFANPHLTGLKTVYEYNPSSDITGVKNSSHGYNNPKQFRLHQNYPNPFNPATTIQYSLLSQDFVTLKVYNCLGQELQTLVSEIVDAGRPRSATISCLPHFGFAAT